MASHLRSSSKPRRATMASHLRSNSLPSRPHSLEAQPDDELNKIRANLASSSPTIKTMSDGLRRLRDIYNCIAEILCLPSNQVGLSQPMQKKWVEEELERSLELLDLCNSMQQNFIETKMSVPNIQLVLQRGSDVAIQETLPAYVRLAKKVKNIFRKIGNKSGSTYPEKEDCSLAVVLRLLIAAREVTVSHLETTLCILSKQIGMPNAS